MSNYSNCSNSSPGQHEHDELTAEEIGRRLVAEERDFHRPFPPKPSVCGGCLQRWPCRSDRLLRHIEALQQQVSKQREKIEDLENANAWYESQLNEIDGALEEAGRPAGEDAGSEAERIREMANAEIGHATLAANAKIAMDGLQQKVEALQARYNRTAALMAWAADDQPTPTMDVLDDYLGVRWDGRGSIEEADAEVEALRVHGIKVAWQAAEAKGES